MQRKGSGGFTLIELLIVVAIIGIIAAIAVPALLRARLASNEAATIGDIRTVLSAQAAYQSANTGFFDNALTCLLEPSNAACIPSYPPTAPTFLDSVLGGLCPPATGKCGLTKSGYDRYVETGPVVVCGPACSVTSTGSMAYLASAMNQDQSGVRSFGGDVSGILCFDPNGGGLVTTSGLGVLSTAAGTCEILR